MPATPPPEFSLLVDVARVTPAGLTLSVEPDGMARERIARRLGVTAVTRLRVDFTLRAGIAGAVDASGVLDAAVVRDCVTTSVAFEAPVAERFALRFVPGEELGDIDDPESVDEIAFDGRAIDLGDAAVEQLALNLDPFPRAPGAPSPDAASGDDGHAGSGDDGHADAGPDAAPDGNRRSNPFAVLGRLRGK